MKKVFALIILCALSAGCKREQEPNKIIDGLPISSGPEVLPARAIQQFLLLKRDMLAGVIPTINKLGLAGITFPDAFPGLTSIGGGQYQFPLSESHYGSAMCTIQFFDLNGAVLNPDPIADPASTTTFKSVGVTVTASSPLFPTISESLLITIEVAGLPTTDKKVTTVTPSSFANANHTVLFTLPAPGCTATYQGLRDGSISITGTGPNASPIAGALQVSTDHDLDGTLSWEGQTGGVHVSDDGAGFVTTENNRSFFN